MAIPGTFPLQYTGVNATNPPQFVIYDRAPTVYDYQNFALGTIWEYQIKVPGNPPTYGTSQIWVLVAMANSIGTWKRLRGAGSGPVQGSAIKVTVLDTPGAGTFTFDPSMTQVQVECIGGGGGGNAYKSGGGGGGAYCKKLFDSDSIGASQPLVVGDAGAGGIYAGASPTDGTATTFGSGPILSAGPGTAALITIGSGGLATGGDINIAGQSGPAISNGSAAIPSGMGGNSGNSYGFGGNYGEAASGYICNASGYGAGGGSSTDATVGGNGSSGVIIITEYLG